MIHFVYVILETDAYFYSCYYDILDRLYEMYRSSSYRQVCNQLKVSILWDSDQSKHTLIHSFSADQITKVKVERSINISNQVSSFINESCRTSLNDFLICSMYVHGNIWFLRHCKKIITLQSILDKLEYKFKVFCLESCYSSSIENCLSLLNNTEVFVTSEHTHSRCSIFTPYFIEWLRSQSNLDRVDALECATALSRGYIQRVDSFPYRDVDTLSLVTDIVVIDMNAFASLFALLRKLKINRQSYSVYQLSKVNPKRDKHKLGYDVWSVIDYSGEVSIEDKTKFTRLFQECIVYYLQSKWFRDKPRSIRSHGLCWAPAPYDSDNGWTYKLISAFVDQDRLLVY